MRIIGGKYRGKKLFSPDNGKVRPTSDRAREALFNILRSRLGNDWSNFRFLDVFAGSGAMAWEALSQGVAVVTLVDADTGPLLKNASLFKDEKAKIRIIKSPAQALGVADDGYDILFCDAPYHQNLTVPVLCRLAEKNWLRAGAWCLIEVAKDEICPLPAAFVLLEERRYGAAKVIIARYQG